MHYYGKSCQYFDPKICLIFMVFSLRESKQLYSKRKSITEIKNEYCRNVELLVFGREAPNIVIERVWTLKFSWKTISIKIRVIFFEDIKANRYFWGNVIECSFMGDFLCKKKVLSRKVKVLQWYVLYRWLYKLM